MTQEAKGYISPAASVSNFDFARVTEKGLVLANTVFGSNQFVTKVRQRKHHVLVGVYCDRIKDGRNVS